MGNIFRATEGRGSDWDAACAHCLERLFELPVHANPGFVYASDPLAEALDLIVTRLREATGVSDESAPVFRAVRTDPGPVPRS